MDTDWCLSCGRRTSEGNEAYCSKTCMTLDRTSVAQSLPIHVSARRPSFDLPVASPPRRISYTRSQARHVERRKCTSDGFPRGYSHNKARFHDDELQDSHPSTFVAARWSGKDRDGILMWAHAVFPGYEEERELPAIDTTSMPDLDKLLTRPPIFPLTAQNLAPPYVTMAPKHVLLSHTALHSSHPEDRTAPSLSQDDASLLTPATDSVITPSVPDLNSLPASKTRISRLLDKVCSWMMDSSRGSRATPEGNPTPPSPADDCLAIHSHETARCFAAPYGSKSTDGFPISPTSSSRSRPYVPVLGSGQLYQ